MKDPIVEEVRRHRGEHAQKFQLDLRLICDDLREFEKHIDNPLVPAAPKRIDPQKHAALK